MRPSSRKCGLYVDSCPQWRNFERLIPVQADGNMLVARSFGFFLPWFSRGIWMTWGQRLSALLHPLTRIATVMLAGSLILLPIGIWPQQSDNYELLVPKSRRCWLKRLFLAAYLASKFNIYVLFQPVGTRGQAAHRSYRTWSAPCKSFVTISS